MTETRNQKIIREILGDEEAPSDTSLRAQTLRRARSQTPPRTLTAFEWEQWYAEHGVPAEHREQPVKNPPDRPWWRRWFGR